MPREGHLEYVTQEHVQYITANCSIDNSQGRAMHSDVCKASTSFHLLLEFAGFHKNKEKR